MVTSLRLRLAVWYACLLALILAATAFVSYSFHSISHYDDVDRALTSTAIHVRGTMLVSGEAVGPDGALKVPSFEEHTSPEIYVRLYDADGRLVASSRNAGSEPGIDPRIVASSPRGGQDNFFGDSLMRSFVRATQPVIPGEGGFLTAVSPETQERTRFYGLPIVEDGAVKGYLEAAQPLAPLDHSMDRLRTLLMVSSAVGLLASLLGGWLIAASALRPVAAMAETAGDIALSRSFARRLPEISRRDELGQLADTFNEMLDSLEEAYRTQQRFIADASHELRAPLTSILGNLELLDRAPDMDEAEKSEALGFVREEANRMNRLVADLLALARADAGQTLNMQPVELDRILMDVLGENQARVSDRKLTLSELDEVKVQGDPDRLKQLLLILVDNAIKYTPAGGEIRLGLRAEAGKAILTVADTGIGIDSADLPHVFDRFYRADKARSRDQGGTGLGLSIAQWIVDQHHGEISVESKPGKGTVFTVELLFLSVPSKAPLSRF